MAVEQPNFLHRVVMVVLVLLVAALIGTVLWVGMPVLLLLFGAILLAVFLDGLASFVADRTPLSHGWSLLLVCLLLVALNVGAWMWMGPQLVDQFAELKRTAPAGLDRIKAWLDDNRLGQMILERIPEDTSKIMGSSSGAVGRVTGWFSTVLGWLTNILIILVVGLYLAADPGIYKSGIVHLVPKDRRARASEVVSALGQGLRRWLLGRLSSMALVGVLTVIGLWFMDMPLALTLAFLAAMFSFIPNLGPFLGAAPALLVGLMQSPQTALYVALLYMGVQLVESYALTPIIQKRAVALPPALLISAQILLGVLLGFAGLIVATPLTVATIILVQMLYVEDILDDDVKVLGAKS